MKHSDVFPLRIFTAAPLDYSLTFISSSAWHSVVLHSSVTTLAVHNGPLSQVALCKLANTHREGWFGKVSTECKVLRIFVTEC
jgi:hypothetical protein